MTDIERIFCKLSTILGSGVDLREREAPVYNISTSTWENGSVKRGYPTFIRFAGETGKCYKFTYNNVVSYLLPVYKETSDDVVYELNLNKVLSRDLPKGVLTNVSFSLSKINNSGEESTVDSYTVPMWPDNFSNTVKKNTMFDIMNLIHEIVTTQNKIDFVPKKTVYSISKNSLQNYVISYISGERLLSQYEDYSLEVKLLGLPDNVIASELYVSDPSDTQPENYNGLVTNEYENTFAHKYHMSRNGDNSFIIHLSDVMNDFKVGSTNGTCSFVIKLIKKVNNLEGDIHLYGTFPVTLRFTEHDEDVSPEEIKAIFRILHDYSYA